MGLAFERSGGSRTARRLLGWLTVCEPAHQSAEQLAAALPASTGSISTTARQLMAMGFVERVGLPGDRKANYQLREDSFAAMMQVNLAEFTAYRELADKGLAALGEATEARRRRLHEMRRLFAFFEHEVPDLFRRYRSTTAKGEGESR